MAGGWAPLRAEGYDVRFDLKRDPDCIVVVDPRVGGNVVFGHAEIAAPGTHPEARVLHRVNECDLRKGTNEIDALLAEINAVADHTVFISEWLRDYHAERWFDLARPNSVILNGADTAIFNPAGSEELPDGGPMGLVTHHWSSNPLKGFDVYAEVDRLIADGKLDGVELWVIGRWPDSCEWRAARTFQPTAGQELADLLRQGHVYLTASRFEPGGMHVVEGLQCGLPLALPRGRRRDRRARPPLRDRVPRRHRRRDRRDALAVCELPGACSNKRPNGDTMAAEYSPS